MTAGLGEVLGQTQIIAVMKAAMALTPSRLTILQGK
jgi:hypothetical protein